MGIVLAIKTGKKPTEGLGEIYSAELFGTREAKFAALNDDVPLFEKVEVTSPNYYFVSKDMSALGEYTSGVNLNDLMPNATSGVTTSKDVVNIQNSPEDVEKVINDLIILNTENFRTKYNTGLDSRDWSIDRARKDVGNFFDNSKVSALNYRIFDIRYIYYTGTTNGIVAWPRFRLLSPLLDNRNIGLIFKRGLNQPESAPVFIVKGLIDRRFWSRPGMQGAEVCAPLYKLDVNGELVSNFVPTELAKLTANLVLPPSPEDVLFYIYATLHSPSYREKYKEFLKTDFPYVPIPNQSEFNRLAVLGRELSELHLLKSHINYDTTFPEQGDNEVLKLIFLNNKIWINDTQYFGNVSEQTWNFYVGGYQPAQKWLKDRKGKILSDKDLDHYQKILKVLVETDRIIKKID